jgi:hypothetical protein
MPEKLTGLIERVTLHNPESGLSDESATDRRKRK